MKNKTLLVSLLVMLSITGCYTEMPVYYINNAVLQCKDHGGLYSISNEYIVYAKITCNDGTTKAFNYNGGNNGTK